MSDRVLPAWSAGVRATDVAWRPSNGHAPPSADVGPGAENPEAFPEKHGGTSEPPAPGLLPRVRQQGINDQASPLHYPWLIHALTGTTGDTAGQQSLLFLASSTILSARYK